MAIQSDKILEKAISTGSAQPSTLLLANISGINLNTMADQPITLKGGNTFIITDILITNVSAVPVMADDGEWWTGPERSGNVIAGTNEPIPPCFNVFTSSTLSGNCIINWNANGTFIQLGRSSSYSAFPTVSSLIYFSLGTPEGSPLTCDMYIYGTILN
jgi:hypothetical protein